MPVLSCPLVARSRPMRNPATTPTYRARPMRVKYFLCLVLNLAALCANAQAVTDRDAKDAEAPAAPSFNKAQLIPIEMPRYVSLRFGVDPATLSITTDGIVRYVMVATSESGTINAMYEGIRCATGEVKTYARYTGDGQWLPLKDAPWRELNDNLPSRHALALARQGACESRSAPASSVAAIVHALKNPNQGRYR